MTIVSQWNATGAAISSIAALSKGATTSVTQLASAFSVLTPAQIAHLAVTNNLDDELLIAAILESQLSDSQMEEAYAAYEAATAKTADKAATDGLTFSVGNLTKALGANIKKMGAWLCCNFLLVLEYCSQQ